MDLIKCPICGEMYSPSYRRCPFCEEEERPNRTSVKHRGGHHVAERKHTHSARGPLAAVLLVVLVVLSWYLFGGKFMEKIQEDQDDAAEVVTPVTQDDTTVTTDDSTAAPDESAPPVVEDTEPIETDNTDSGDTAESAAVDLSALWIKTNVGTTLQKMPGTDIFDCTIRTSDSIQFILQGTDAAATWSSEDTSVATISADGVIKPVKAGTATVTASVGVVEVKCVVRINN